MEKEVAIKIGAVILVVLVLLNFFLWLLGYVSGLSFWITAAVAAVAAWFVVPWAKKKV